MSPDTAQETEKQANSLQIATQLALENYNPLKNFYAIQKQSPTKIGPDLILSPTMQQEQDQSSKKKKMVSVQAGRIQNKFRLVLLASYTMYPIVRTVCRKSFKMRIVEDESTCEDFDLMWADHAIPLEKLMRFKPHQRHSQLPGISCLTRKNSLAQNLNKMRAKFPEIYDFYPQTYLYPKDMAKLRNEWKADTVLIVKPEASCQGKGIYLTREIDDICEEHCVVQIYIDRPLLMEKMKFDLRVYVLVLGTDPLRIFLSKEGLARLSTKNYEEVNDENLDDITMHLTNYAINKNSAKFQANRAAILDSAGHKRSLKFALKYIEKCCKKDSNVVMDEIKDIIVKTMISGQAHLSNAFKQCQLDDFENSMCFQILGFDIMMDYQCKPYLLEVNHSPSFSTDSPLDEKVKGELIRDAVRLLCLTKRRRQMYSRNYKALLDHRMMVGKFLRIPPEEKERYRAEFNRIRDEFEMQHLGSFEKIYPTDNVFKAKNFEDLLKFQKKAFDESNSYGLSKKNIRNNLQDSSQSKSPTKRFIAPAELKRGPELTVIIAQEKQSQKQSIGLIPFSPEGDLQITKGAKMPSQFEQLKELNQIAQQKNGDIIGSSLNKMNTAEIQQQKSQIVLKASQNDQSVIFIDSQVKVNTPNKLKNQRRLQSAQKDWQRQSVVHYNSILPYNTNQDSTYTGGYSRDYSQKRQEAVQTTVFTLGGGQEKKRNSKIETIGQNFKDYHPIIIQTQLRACHLKLKGTTDDNNDSKDQIFYQQPRESVIVQRSSTDQNLSNSIPITEIDYPTMHQHKLTINSDLYQIANLKQKVLNLVVKQKFNSISIKPPFAKRSQVQSRSLNQSAYVTQSMKDNSGGSYVRPKVLDFQPRQGFSDPLLDSKKQKVIKRNRH